jgi:hypothetical protein
MTRHGDGPLMHDSFFTHNTSVDQTNVFNEYQGRIRSAPIDIDDINRRFYFAKKEVMTNIVESSIIHDSINSNLVVTHCQYDYCSVIMDRGFHKIGRTEFLNAIGASYISCAEDDTELSSWPY